MEAVKKAPQRLPKAPISTCYIDSTMGPGIKIDPILPNPWRYQSKRRIFESESIARLFARDSRRASPLMGKR